ncbi:hypothetical protein DdX_15844 [Ditylenchus destructor]|uniref:Uncharacterized protein n=1 Tax=Ditylenchus destructor TaxID=166010 RepID=A0AAD4R0N6_9BILA|nr:hypothetical protein DdX_15844 [Ditylenchus destructor]
MSQPDDCPSDAPCGTHKNDYRWSKRYGYYLIYKGTYCFCSPRLHRPRHQPKRDQFVGNPNKYQYKNALKGPNRSGFRKPQSLRKQYQSPLKKGLEYELGSRVKCPPEAPCYVDKQPDGFLAMFVCFVKKIFLLAAIIPITKCEITCFYEDLTSVDSSNITDCERIVVGWVSFDPEGYTRFSGAKHYGQAMLSLLRLTSLAHKSDPPTKVLIGVTSVQYGSTAANDEYVDQETIFGYLSALVLNANSDGFIFVLPEEEINLLLTVNLTAHTFWKSIYLRMKSGSEKMQSAAHTLAISPKLLVDTASFNTTAIVESFSSIMLFDRHKILMCNESGALPKFEVANATSEQAGPVCIAKRSVYKNFINAGEKSSVRANSDLPKWLKEAAENF